MLAVAADGSAAPTPLHPADFGVAALVAMVPETNVARVESVDGGDHSLYGVKLSGESRDPAPTAVTPVDDVGERFVGFVVIGPAE